MNDALKQILTSAAKGVVQGLAKELTTKAVNYFKPHASTEQLARIPVTCIGGYYKDMGGFIYFHNSFDQWFLLTNYGQWTPDAPSSQFFLVAYLYQDSGGYYYMQTSQGWLFLDPQKGWLSA